MDEIIDAINKQKETNVLLLEERKSLSLHNKLKKQILEYLLANKEMIKYKLTLGSYITNLQIFTDINYVPYSLLTEEDIEKTRKELYDETHISMSIGNDSKVISLDIII